MPGLCSANQRQLSGPPVRGISPGLRASSLRGGDVDRVPKARPPESRRLQQLRISASGVLFSWAYPSGLCRFVRVNLTLQYGRDWAVVQDFSQINRRAAGQMWQSACTR